MNGLALGLTLLVAAADGGDRSTTRLRRVLDETAQRAARAVVSTPTTPTPTTP